jgi:hypothetical protein
MKKFVLAPALAALAIFVWGFLYWGVPHNLPYKALETLPDNDAAGEALQKIFPRSGVYVLPSPLSDPQRVAEQMAKGPHATISIMKEGHPMMEPSLLAKGYLHGFVVCVLLMMLLERCAASFKGYFCRVRFCTGVGVIGSVFCEIGTAIWWYQPMGWHLVTVLYDVVAFALGGAVLAAFARKTPVVAPATVPA